VDVSLLPTGHDAWVVGDESVVVVDFEGMVDYARGWENVEPKNLHKSCLN